MTVAKSTRSLDEVAVLGEEIFDRQIRPALGPKDDGKFVAIDVETGANEMDEDDYTAIVRLKSRLPAADIWLMRVGYRATCRIGAIQ